MFHTNDSPSLYPPSVSVSVSPLSAEELNTASTSPSSEREIVLVVTVISVEQDGTTMVLESVLDVEELDSDEVVELELSSPVTAVKNRSYRSLSPKRKLSLVLVDPLQFTKKIELQKIKINNGVL